MSSHKEKPLSNGNITKSVDPSLSTTLRLAMPVILLNLTFAAMQATDAWIVGKLGSRSLAAITLPSMGIFVIVSFAYSFLGIVTAFVGQSHGASDKKNCGQFAWIGIYSSLAIAISAILLWPLGSVFEIFAGSEHGSLGNLESRYFKISLLALPGVLVTNAIANFYIGTKRPGPVLICSVIGLILNFTITYGLVLGIGPFPNYGFDGAAWGTVLATMIECSILFIHFISAKSNKAFNTRKAPKSLEGIRRLWATGLPAGIQGAVDILSWGVLVGVLISYYGEEALAAGTILMRCMQLTFMPAEGIATVVLTLVANSVGRGSQDRARAHVRTCFKINSLFMLSSGIILYIFRKPIVSMFTDQPEVISIACGGMLFVSLAQWFDSMNITYLHALQGTGDTKWPSVVNVLLSVLVLGLGGTIAVSFFREKGSLVIWALALFYISCQGILFWMRWRSESWRKIRLRNPTR
ncbi:MAG: MATE family efflux transporter [Verrucomicrobiales bacterium]|nr:MATE family efflux transporter [Verrucomicrobiales bacterium]